MEITGVIWLDEIVEKLEYKHRVSIYEVEEVMSSKPRFKKMQKGRFRGEDVFRALGQTYSGRYLVVIFIYKRTKQALVLSARDMDQKERRSYGKK